MFMPGGVADLLSLGRRGGPNCAADLLLFWRSLLPFLACIYRTLLDIEM